MVEWDVGFYIQLKFWFVSKRFCEDKNLQALLSIYVWNDEDIKEIERAIEGFKNG